MRNRTLALYLWVLIAFVWSCAGARIACAQDAVHFIPDGCDVTANDLHSTVLACDGDADCVESLVWAACGPNGGEL